MSPLRWVDIDKPARPANDLAASFEASTRRGDVIGALKRAAQAPRRGNRPAKVRDGAPRSIEAVRVEQATAWLEALVEVADHGPTADLLGAMHALVLAMDGRLRDRAQDRLDAIENGEPIADVAKLRRELSRMRAPAAPPPSGPRHTVEWTREAIRLRWSAAEALGEMLGDVAPGCYRLGGVQASGDDARTLGQMMSELSAESFSKSNVPWMAKQAAVLALQIADTVPALRRKADVAAERLEALASFVEQGGAG